jgi:peroxiredoxin
MVSLGDYRGKVVIVNFWGTYCGPCVAEIPDFIGLQARYGSKGLQVIGIGLDEPGTLMKFARKNGMNYEVLIGTNATAWHYYGSTATPRTFLIDKRGRIVKIYGGPESESFFEGEIRPLLE